MPNASQPYCLETGCSVRVPHGSGRCSLHQRAIRRTYRGNYDSSSPVSYWRRKWRRLARAYLDLHPWCVGCLPVRRVASEVDHKIPHERSEFLFWDEGNWQSLCKSCHAKKTNREVRERSHE